MSLLELGRICTQEKGRGMVSHLGANLAGTRAYKFPMLLSSVVTIPRLGKRSCSHQWISVADVDGNSQLKS